MAPNYLKLISRNKDIKIIAGKIIDGKSFGITGSYGAGKTTLVKLSLKEVLNQKYYNIIFIDLLKITEDSDLLNHFHSVTSLLVSKKIQKKLTELNLLNSHDLKAPFVSLLEFVGELKSPSIIIFDNYEPTSEILNFKKDELIEHINQLDNIQFLFVEDVEISMDSQKKLHIKPIKNKQLKKYLIKLFQNYKTQIKPKQIEIILNWSKFDIRATDKLCKILLSSKIKKIKPGDIFDSIQIIYLEYEPTYKIIKNMLSPYQWKLLTSIAREGTAHQITSNGFINKYKLNAPSSVKTALLSLSEKGLIKRKENSYKLTDVIMSNWLADHNVNIIT